MAVSLVPPERIVLTGPGVLVNPRRPDDPMISKTPVPPDRCPVCYIHSTRRIDETTALVTCPHATLPHFIDWVGDIDLEDGYDGHPAACLGAWGHEGPCLLERVAHSSKWGWVPIDRIFTDKDRPRVAWLREQGRKDYLAIHQQTIDRATATGLVIAC